MKALGYAATRLLPLMAAAGLTAATLQTWVGTITAVGTALYTVFVTIEAGLRLYERWKLKHASPRAKGPDA